MLEKQKKCFWRHKRTRAKISGTAKVPRLCVFRSNKYIYAQLINDENGKIILAASDSEIKKTKKTAGKKKVSGEISAAFEVGKSIAKLAREKKIKRVVFDRGGYKYHGRVKALAEGAKEGGLSFIAKKLPTVHTR
jgi:large subunit ribosomal protein L18